MNKEKVHLSPPTHFPAEFVQVWKDWLFRVFDRVGDGPFKVQGFEVANLPSAADWGSVATDKEFSSIIFVHDETGGATLAFSDGTDWRRVQDRAVVA
jgi:hypothetical protein